MTTYSQRYAAGDSNTAGAFYFDTITSVDYAATKIGYGAAGSVTWVDASNPLPVSVIAALPAGTNAIGKLAPNSGIDIGDVDVTSIIPGTGATNLGKAIDTATGGTDTGVLTLATRDDALSTLVPAEGDNVQLRVDGNGALWCVISNASLTVADGGGSITVDGTVTISDGGSSITVDGTVSASQNGTWTVTANQGGTWNVDTVSTVAAVTTVSTVTNVATIGTSVTPGTGAANLGKAEDSAHNHADTGVFVLAVRRDTAAAGADIDGDYASLNVNSTGHLWCASVQSGTWSIRAQDGSGNALTSAARGSERALSVQIVDGSGNQITTFGGSGGTASTDDAAFTAASGSGTPVMGFVTSDSVDSGDVGVVGMTTDRQMLVRATNAGTFAVQVDGTALTRLTDIETNTDYGATTGNGAASGSLRVTLANDSTGVLATVSTLTGGGVAHDAADSGNPHKIGAKATTALSGVTLVADADRTDLRAGVDGVLIARPHTGLEDIVSGNASNTDGTSTQCLAAAGAGVKTYLQTIILTNTSSSNTYCEIKDGSTTKLTIPVPANGGAVVNLPVPIGGTANTAWNFDPGAATTTMYCSMVGWKSKV